MRVRHSNQGGLPDVQFTGVHRNALIGCIPISVIKVCFSGVTGGEALQVYPPAPRERFRGEVTPRLLYVLDTQSLPMSIRPSGVLQCRSGTASSSMRTRSGSSIL